jgi:signal recognition particle subunit SRP54
MLDNLTKRLGGIFSGLRRQGRLTEQDVNEAMREIRVALLEADVNFAIAKEFVARIKEKAVGEEVFGSLNAEQTIVKLVRDELVALLGGGDTPMNWGSQPPTIVLMAGLQGSGKTTTTAKLAKWFQRQGKKPMLAACDLQRPAAVKQLQVLGEQLGVPVFGPEEAGGTTNPVEVAQKAVDRAKYLFNDVLILDTAGRLSIDEELMAQLGEVAAVTKPNEVFLVLDSTTGQEAVNVAMAFHERLQLTGAVFTKLDGDARGGAVLSVRQATGVPVRFVGTGEQVDALDQFHPDRLAGRIIGMGDVMGIIERAEQAVTQEEAQGIEAKMKSGKWDFNDLLAQLSMIKKMGPLKNVMKMIPGVAANLPDEAFDSFDDKMMDRTQAIVLSMTLKERNNPDILNGSRRRRIAAGSGTSPEEVNRVIDSLYMMRRSMKQMTQMEKKMKKFGMKGRR